ncbi:hypothetical protein PG985_007330 [Apiospora marii]|uniref:Uncharacterized protein n=1 Tax=Apiospora marii TaxID=335849 RepID=A0ABR1SNU5_9PEZI
MIVNDLDSTTTGHGGTATLRRPRSRDRAYDFLIDGTPLGGALAAMRPVPDLGLVGILGLIGRN